MADISNASIVAHFSVLKDPRHEEMTLHNFQDILIISICAMICGIEHWTEVELFAKAKESWFSTFLELPAGIPSHDTFGRVFSLLPPRRFQRCFTAWVREAVGPLKRQTVPIDGKTICGSRRKGKKLTAFHVVSAWSTRNGVALGQKKVNDKSNEITAIPGLLDELLLKGCIVTIDAMGCQKEIAAKIIEKDADYVLALKKNHEKMFNQAEEPFEEGLENGFEDMETFEKSEKGHGREEKRTYWLTKKIDSIEGIEEWPGLKSIGYTLSERTIGEETSIDYRFFLTSLDGGVEEFATSVREHWQVENSLHWVLDVGFREDESRVREGYGAENMAMLRKMALNLLKQDKSIKAGIKSKRKVAGWDHDYLLKLLFSL